LYSPDAEIEYDWPENVPAQLSPLASAPAAVLVLCGELDAAMGKAESCGTGAYIEVVTDKYVAPPMAMKLHESIKAKVSLSAPLSVVKTTRVLSSWPMSSSFLRTMPMLSSKGADGD
jgi:hypothetical protein